MEFAFLDPLHCCARAWQHESSSSLVNEDDYTGARGRGAKPQPEDYSVREESPQFAERRAPPFNGTILCLGFCNSSLKHAQQGQFVWQSCSNNYNCESWRIPLIHTLLPSVNLADALHPGGTEVTMWRTVGSAAEPLICQTTQSSPTSTTAGLMTVRHIGLQSTIFVEIQKCYVNTNTKIQTGQVHKWDLHPWWSNPARAHATELPHMQRTKRLISSFHLFNCLKSS